MLHSAALNFELVFEFEMHCFSVYKWSLVTTRGLSAHDSLHKIGQISVIQLQLLLSNKKKKEKKGKFITHNSAIHS